MSSKRQKELNAFWEYPYVVKRRDWAGDAASNTAKAFINMIDKAETVVDLGCMAGAMIRNYLRPKFPDAKIYGVDLMKPALEYAQEKGGAAYLEMDLDNPGTLRDAFGFNAVDLFVTTDTLEHLLVPKICLNQAYNTLKPGGKIVAVMPYLQFHNGGDHRSFYSEEGWAKLFEECGFEVCHSQLCDGITQVVIMAAKPGKIKTAFALYGFNRPQYLKQVVASIDRAEDKKDIDFYYFQDGAVNVISGHRWCTDQLVTDNLKIVASAETPFTIVNSGKNYGAGMQQMRSTELLFDTEKYDVVIGSVEDHLVSRYYFSIRKALIRQFMWDPQAFCVVNSWVNFMNAGKKIYAMDKFVRCKNTTSPGWTLFRNKWYDMKAIYMSYYDMMSKMDYHERNHDGIRKTFGIGATGHDGGFEWAISQTAMDCILPVMNRIQDIGMFGLHKRPEINREHIERVTLHEFDAEPHITKFYEDARYFNDLEFNPGILRR